MLLNRFVLRYKEKHGTDPVLNRYTAKWPFLNMVTDLGVDRALKVVDYFFELPGAHPTTRLFKNYDKMYKAMVNREEDAERRRQLREETDQMVREWKRNV